MSLLVELYPSITTSRFRYVNWTKSFRIAVNDRKYIANWLVLSIQLRRPRCGSLPDCIHWRAGNVWCNKQPMMSDVFNTSHNQLQFTHYNQLLWSNCNNRAIQALAHWSKYSPRLSPMARPLMAWRCQEPLLYIYSTASPITRWAMRDAVAILN